MLTWICKNIGVIIVCAVLIAIVAAIIISTIRNKKQGRSSCGCGCSCCPMEETCHTDKI